MSTVFGVTILAFINSYMVLVFFKTIFLVIVIGVFHALLLLPIVLCMTAPVTDRINEQCCEQPTNSSQDIGADSRLQSGPHKLVIGVK
ncbi:unnamed protein product [Gongylonema pulchrum]|uniref:MMPL domain-containing protein n=1 Tax=Gongylonema pulchrum TaxID=637853 RepID=A0A183EFE6_9BILA|nr:unnamed protein product [Gongylonema pulchrum]